MANKTQFGAGVRFFVQDASKAVTDTNRIAGGFGVVQDTAGNAALAVQDTSMGVVALQAKFVELKQIGRGFVGVGKGIFKSLFNAGKEVATLGGKMESSRKQFELAFKDADIAQEKLRGAQDVAARTNLDTFEVLDSVFKMQIKGVDALKEYNGQWSEGGKIVKGQVGSLQLINDLITGSGQDSQNVFRNLNKALSGTNINFRALFDGLQTAEETASFKSAKTAQVRMDVIAQTILRTFGGISKTAEGTFGFVVDNIGDVMQILKSTVGEKLLPSITPLVTRVLQLIDAMAKNEKFLKAMADGVQVISDIVGPLVTGLLDLADIAVDLISSHPGLVKFALVLSLVVATVALLTGAFILLVAAVGTFMLIGLPAMITGLAALGSVMTAVGAAMAPVLLVIGALTVAALLVKTAFDENFGGIRDTVNKVKVGFIGFLEIVKNWKDGTSSMSKETAENLKKAGILDFVVRMGGLFGSIIDVVKQVGNVIFDVLVSAWVAVKPVVMAVFEVMGALISVFFDFIGAATGQGTALRGTKRDATGLKDVFDLLIIPLELVAKEMTSIAKTIKNEVIPTFRDLAFFAGAVVAMYTDIIEESGKFGTEIGDVMADIQISIEENDAAWERWGQRNQQTVIDAWNGIIDSTASFIGPWLDLVVGEMIDPMVEAWTSFSDDTTFILEEMWNILDENVFSPFNTMIDNLIIKLGNIGPAIEDAIPGVKQFLNLFGDDTGEGTRGAPELAANIGPVEGLVPITGRKKKSSRFLEDVAREKQAQEAGLSTDLDVPDAASITSAKQRILVESIVKAQSDKTSTADESIAKQGALIEKLTKDLLELGLTQTQTMLAIQEALSTASIAEGFETALNNAGDRHPLTDNRAS